MKSDYKNNNNLSSFSLLRDSSKGVQLENPKGAQNCFLNVIIQTLYNIDEIRTYFSEKRLRVDNQYSLLYSLQTILSEYDKTRKNNDYVKKALNPISLRMDLSKLFEKEKKFEMSQMNDPVEALIAILNAFHSFHLKEKDLTETEKICNAECLSHSLFWISLIQQNECQCRGTSEPTNYCYNYFLFEVYVNEILDYSQKETNITSKFINYLKKTNSRTNSSCPAKENKCKYNNVRRNIILLNNPKYLFFNCIWSNPKPKLLEICRFYFSLTKEFDPKELFVMQTSQNQNYRIKTIVCYWSAHYICFVQFDDDNWECYDDDQPIIKLRYRDIVQRSLNKHFYPVLVLYERIDNRTPMKTISPDFSASEQSSIIKECEKIDYLNERKMRSISSNPYQKRNFLEERKENLKKNEEFTQNTQEKNKNLTESIIVSRESRNDLVSVYEVYKNKPLIPEDQIRKLRFFGDNNNIIQMQLCSGCKVKPTCLSDILCLNCKNVKRQEEKTKIENSFTKINKTPSEMNQWICSICSGVNPNNTEKCNVCKSRQVVRGTCVIEPRKTNCNICYKELLSCICSSKNINSDQWKCYQCSTVNSQMADKCKKCNLSDHKLGESKIPYTQIKSCPKCHREYINTCANCQNEKKYYCLLCRSSFQPLQKEEYCSKCVVTSFKCTKCRSEPCHCSISQSTIQNKIKYNVNTSINITNCEKCGEKKEVNSVCQFCYGMNNKPRKESCMNCTEDARDGSRYCLRCSLKRGRSSIPEKKNLDDKTTNSSINYINYTKKEQTKLETKQPEHIPINKTMNQNVYTNKKQQYVEESFRKPIGNTKAHTEQSKNAKNTLSGKVRK